MNPEVITYDELYSRAEFIVAKAATDDPAEPEPPPDDCSWNDDFPF